MSLTAFFNSDPVFGTILFFLFLSFFSWLQYTPKSESPTVVEAPITKTEVKEQATKVQIQLQQTAQPTTKVVIIPKQEETQVTVAPTPTQTVTVTSGRFWDEVFSYDPPPELEQEGEAVAEDLVSIPMICDPWDEEDDGEAIGKSPETVAAIKQHEELIYGTKNETGEEAMQKMTQVTNPTIQALASGASPSKTRSPSKGQNQPQKQKRTNATKRRTPASKTA